MHRTRIFPLPRAACLGTIAGYRTCGATVVPRHEGGTKAKRPGFNLFRRRWCVERPVGVGRRIRIEKLGVPNEWSGQEKGVRS